MLGAGRGRTPPETVGCWSKHYARSFGKAQRDEARARMLAHGFGAVDDDEVEDADDVETAA